MSWSKDMIFGAASAAYQVEGAYNCDGRGLSIWDALSDGYVKHGDNGNIACDEYHRFRGAMIPATTARILSLESATTFMCKLNVCRNQMIIVAKKITVNALCKKSFAFSHRSCPTFFAPGIR